MRLRGDQLVQRVAGTVLGMGFFLLGLFSALGAGGDRAFWLGITMMIIGPLAVVASLIVERLDQVWCRHPRRWGRPW